MITKSPGCHPEVIPVKHDQGVLIPTLEKGPRQCPAVGPPQGSPNDCALAWPLYRTSSSTVIAISRIWIALVNDLLTDLRGFPKQALSLMISTQGSRALRRQAKLGRLIIYSFELAA